MPPLVWKRVMFFKSNTMIKQFLFCRLQDIMFFFCHRLVYVLKADIMKIKAFLLKYIGSGHSNEEGKVRGICALCIYVNKKNWNVSNSKYIHTGTKWHTWTKLFIINLKNQMPMTGGLVKFWYIHIHIMKYFAVIKNNGWFEKHIFKWPKKNAQWK